MNLYEVCKEGNKKGIKILIKKGRINFQDGLEGACEGGHNDLVKMFIDKAQVYKQLNLALNYAAKGGHIEIIKFLINEGADILTCDSAGACEGGYTEVVDYMFELKNTYYNNAVYGAAKGGHLWLIEQLSPYIKHWNWALEGACEGGHKDLVKMFIDKGANNFGLGLNAACKGGYIELVQLMIDLGIDLGINNINEGLLLACEGEHEDLIKYLIKIGANDWNYGLDGVCIGKGSIKIVKRLIKLGAHVQYKHIYYLTKGEVLHTLKYLYNRYVYDTNYMVYKDAMAYVLNMLLLKKQILPVNNDCERIISEYKCL